MTPFLVAQAQAQLQACDDTLRAFARDEDNY
jgi:hypothetical protein